MCVCVRVSLCVGPTAAPKQQKQKKRRDKKKKSSKVKEKVFSYIHAEKLCNCISNYCLKITRFQTETKRKTSVRTENLKLQLNPESLVFRKEK